MQAARKNHHVGLMLNTLSEKIHDNRFLRPVRAEDPATPVTDVEHHSVTEACNVSAFMIPFTTGRGERDHERVVHFGVGVKWEGGDGIRTVFAAPLVYTAAAMRFSQAWRLSDYAARATGRNIQ